MFSTKSACLRLFVQNPAFGSTRWSNIKRTLCLSHEFPAARRLGLLATSRHAIRTRHHEPASDRAPVRSRLLRKAAPASRRRGSRLSAQAHKPGALAKSWPQLSVSRFRYSWPPPPFPVLSTPPRIPIPRTSREGAHIRKGYLAPSVSEPVCSPQSVQAPVASARPREHHS